MMMEGTYRYTSKVFEPTFCVLRHQSGIENGAFDLDKNKNNQMPKSQHRDWTTYPIGYARVCGRGHDDFQSVKQRAIDARW